MGKYDGCAAIVTGASGGLGRAMVERLASHGMETWLVGRTGADLQRVADELRPAASAPLHVSECDIAVSGALANLVSEVGASHPHLFAVVNNAGLMHMEPIMSGRPDRWRAMFDVNVLAVIESCHAAIAAMRRHGKPGHIVNVSSLTSRFHAPTVYGASKLAQEAITATLRKELERDPIRITSLIPGGFASRLGRHLEAETIEGLVKVGERLGIDFTKADSSFRGDPVHIATALEFILDQPSEINIGEIVVRPPVSIEF